MTPAPRLIGRQAERELLAARASGGTVVTVTGPGGVGKSRLVCDLTSGDLGLPGPVTLGHLTGLPAGSGPTTITDALGFESLDAAGVVLSERGGTVVLDGCEHVLPAAREVVTAIAAAAPAVAIVATSRAPLAVPGEQVLVLGPLAVPPRGAVSEGRGPAMELFLERAAAAGAVLGEVPGQLDDVAELCRRLDGLPLAIELAAARARAIAPGELLRAVDHRLGLLRRRDVRGDRHDSMRAAIEVSTALLSDAERHVFDCLGVFCGPLDAALGAAVSGEADTAIVLDVLDGLVERSLLIAEPTAAGTRYRMLELLREHAVETLMGRGEMAAVEARFVDAMVGVADDIVVRALDRWDPGMLSAASAQFANLTRACELCLDRDERPDRAYRLLLPMFAAVHEGRSLDVWAIGERVRRRWSGIDAPWRAEALAVLATAAAIGGRSDDVGPLAAEVVEDRASSDVALALADRAWGLATRDGDPIAAAEHLALARGAARRAGFASLAREVAAFEAGELDVAGESSRAADLLTAVLTEADRDGDVFVVVLALLVRCCVSLRSGDGERAADDLRQAQQRSAVLAHPWWSAATLRMAAAVEALGGAGWEASMPQWRHAVDVAASKGALGEVAITLRVAASVAHHLGAVDDALALLAAAPQASAITVLPALCPASSAALAAAAPAPAPTSLVDALAAARRVLGGREAVAAAPSTGELLAGDLVADGDVWRLTFAGRTVRVRDMKGIGDLAILVSRPGVEVHVLELMGAHDVGGNAGPGLDDRARRAYQARIVELQREVDEARGHHDHARAERAELELDALVEQLSEAFGLGGRVRPIGSSAERARSAVTARVRSAIKKVAHVHPELGRHLTNAVRTGTWCVYRPERDVRWTVVVASPGEDAGSGNGVRPVTTSSASASPSTGAIVRPAAP